VKLCAKKERSDIKTRSDLKKKRPDLQEKGNIYKICALIKIRIVKSLRSGSFGLCRGKISEFFFWFLKHGSRYV
jgi:hypothetical protein